MKTEKIRLFRLRQGRMSEIVNSCLDELLSASEMGEKEVVISRIKNANLIGAAMAVLSKHN